MNVIFFEKGKAEPIARMGGIDAGAVPRPHECVEGITEDKKKRFFVVETTWRKFGEDPNIEALVTVVPVDAAGRLSGCSAEDAMAATLSALPDPDGSAGPAERAESGPIAFGDDWPGLFLRGKHALHFYVALGQVLDWVEHAHANSEGTAIEDVPQFAVVALDGLRKDLGSVNVRKAPSVLRLRPIEECAAPPSSPSR